VRSEEKLCKDDDNSGEAHVWDGDVEECDKQSVRTTRRHSSNHYSRTLAALLHFTPTECCILLRSCVCSRTQRFFFSASSRRR
jgi:RNA:NAD 2'-phosphotransferase (TPT1/KptA family)